MAEHDHDQKTEQATEKRLSEALERGQFARSHELTGLFAIAAVLGVVALTVQSASRDIAEYATGIFTRFASTSVDRESVTGQLGVGLVTVGRVLVPVLLGLVGATLLASGVQSGF